MAEKCAVLSGYRVFEGTPRLAKRRLEDAKPVCKPSEFCSGQGNEQTAPAGARGRELHLKPVSRHRERRAALLTMKRKEAAKELSAAISRFLLTLSRDDRFLFVRRYWYADSVKELAAETRGNADRISVRLFRIREKLKKSLVKEGYLA